MRHNSHVVPLALLAAVANAKAHHGLHARQIVNNPSDAGATTVYYSVCPTATETTITLASTLTYCPGPGCNGGPVITGAPGAGYPGGNAAGLGTEIVDFTTTGADDSTTVYQEFETVYGQPCSTCPGGVVPATFTVTEACPCQASRNPASMPEGFTTTVFACSSCAENGGAMTTTLTVPCSTGPYAAQATNTGGAIAGAGAQAGAGAGTVAGAAGAQATAGASSEAGASSSGSGSSAEAGANSNAASNSGSSGSGTGAGAGANAEASASAAAAAGVGGTSPEIAATATLVPAAGAGATGAIGGNGTVSPQMSPVSAGSGIGTYTPGSGSSKTMTVSGLLAGLAGIFAFLL